MDNKENISILAQIENKHNCLLKYITILVSHFYVMTNHRPSGLTQRIFIISGSEVEAQSKR